MMEKENRDNVVLGLCVSNFSGACYFFPADTMKRVRARDEGCSGVRRGCVARGVQKRGEKGGALGPV
jgi:hypothetical protein